jgi:hypothetical protein
MKSHSCSEVRGVVAREHTASSCDSVVGVYGPIVYQYLPSHGAWTRYPIDIRWRCDRLAKLAESDNRQAYEIPKRSRVMRAHTPRQGHILTFSV